MDLYDLKVTNIKGEEVSLANYKVNLCSDGSMK